MKRYLQITFFLLLCFPFISAAQGFRLPEGKKTEKVKFELINNLIVIPMEVNGAKLSFILDSGVTRPILFNLFDQDSLQINNVSEITIKGLGEDGGIQALKSGGNIFRLKQIQNPQQLLYVVLDNDLNFSPSLGVPIHGIIGYDLFRDFVVEINYSSKVLKFHDPKYFQPKEHKKTSVLPLAILHRKPYIEGNVFLDEKEDIPVKLMVDTGSSDAVWLFPDEEKGMRVPDKSYEDFLGKGLGGKIYGKRTKIKSVNIGGFQMNDAKAAFPHMDSFSAFGTRKDRNGSVGGEILKRFNIIFDYGNNKVFLKKNRLFNAPFQYNFSGIELQHNGVRYIAERIANYGGAGKVDDKSPLGDVSIILDNRTKISVVPEIIVSGIRAGSPAEEAGLQEGDVILAVNGKRVHTYKLQEILGLLNAKEGKRMRVLINRYGKDVLFSFVLTNAFK
ncbi:PDZ domain-containing protein [Spongiimicrobium salis]|uniref:PDZ domain-containing protein n=1 Tax=Spongiimicrobium salis TaxID=1667022 RepID=UPI00374D3CA5